MTKEIKNIALLLDQNKDYCFSVAYYDSSLNFNIISPPSPENTGKKKFLDAIQRAEMLGLDDIIIELYDKKQDKCSAKPRITKKVKLNEPKLSLEYLGEIGGLQGYIQTSVAVESVRKENDFLRRENQRLIDENRELKETISRLKEKLEQLKEKNLELKWQIRENQIKAQSNLFEKLGSLGLSLLQPQIQSQNLINNGATARSNDTAFSTGKESPDSSEFHTTDKQVVEQFFGNTNKHNSTKNQFVRHETIHGAGGHEHVVTEQSDGSGNRQDDTDS